MSKNSKKKAKSHSSKIKTSKLLFFGSLILMLLILPFIIAALQKTQDTNRGASAAGNALYVSSSGNDSNNGSQSSPFASINKAASVATAGTTVHVSAGTYNESVVNNQSGTATSPIIFISDTKWGAKIISSGNGSTKSYLFRSNGNYVHIVNFDLSGKGVTDGIDLFGSNNIVQGNHIHDMTGINCSGTPGGSGLGDDSGSNNIYDGNIVNNVGDYPTKCDYVHGIYVDDNGDIVRNNIAYNNVGNGLYTNHGTGSVIFTNNFSFANDEYGIGVNGTSGGSGNIVQNNILMGNGLAGIKTWSTVSGTQILNNILFNNPSTVILDGTATQQKTLAVDPQLVNYQANGSGDYHLKATSPAIDAGVSTNAPSTDFDGKSRPQGKGYDIGPYEYMSTAALSPQPNPTTAVPTFVCGGSQNCAGTPAPTVAGNGTPMPTSILTTAPSITAPSTTLPSGIAPSENPSVTMTPITGGNQTVIDLLIKILQEIIQLFQQLLGASHSSGSHHHHHSD